MKNRRTQYEIYWEILTLCKNPKSYTKIINHCNLNSKIGTPHLSFLLEKKYLILLEDKTGSQYQTTEDAHVFLSLFSKMYKELFNKYASSK